MGFAYRNTGNARRQGFGGGRRSASSAARSTTRPTTASPAWSIRRIPRPRISISPRVPGRTTIRFPRLCEMDTVVADQNRRRNLPCPAGQDADQRRGGFTGTGGAADHARRGRRRARQRRAPFRGALRHCAGSLTTKRAPATVGSRLAGRTGRFSAQMRPLWLR